MKYAEAISLYDSILLEFKGHELSDEIYFRKYQIYLVKNNFDVLPYINADPILGKQLEEIGCATVMPLGSPIGSGQGLKNLYNIQILIEVIDKY